MISQRGALARSSRRCFVRACTMARDPQQPGGLCSAPILSKPPAHPRPGRSRRRNASPNAIREGKPGGDAGAVRNRLWPLGPAAYRHLPGSAAHHAGAPRLRNRCAGDDGTPPTRLVAFSDDMDGLRKVPDNVPNQATAGGEPRQAAEPHSRSVRQVTRALRAHNNAMLRDFLDRFGFEYEFVAASTATMPARSTRRCARAAQQPGDHGHHAADAARGAAADLFAGPADHRPRRAVCCRCRSRWSMPTTGIVRFDDRGRDGRAVRARRHGQAAMEGRLGDALGTRSASITRCTART